MIDTSRKVKSPIFSEGIYAFDIWGIPCYRKLVIRGFSREAFKSSLDVIISTFKLRAKEKMPLSPMVVLLTKRISLNVRKLACYSPTVLIILFNAYLKFIFLRRIRQEQLSNFNFIITGVMFAKLHVHVRDEKTCTL